MTKRALLFGGIGTILETSEIQREAFNRAFAEAGLDWVWDKDQYRRLLVTPGGTQRIAGFARARKETGIDAAALHARKTEFFHARLRQGKLLPRPGVARLLCECAELNVLTGLASNTDGKTSRLVLEAAGLDPAAFSVISDRSNIESSKPSGDVYRFCLENLGICPENALAIEDSESGLRAALDAGLSCIVTPGGNTRDQDYGGALATLNCLGDKHVPARILSGADVLTGGAFTLSDWSGVTSTGLA